MRKNNKKVTISIPVEIDQEVESYCTAAYMTKSAFITIAIIDKLNLSDKRYVDRNKNMVQ